MQVVFKKYGITDTMLALLFSSFPITIGLITGPFICYMSDRHRGPLGRRIPYLLVTIPFIVGAIIGLAFSPQLGAFCHRLLGSHSMGESSSILLFLGVFWMIFEFGIGVSNMMFGGLVNDVVPQSLVGRFYGLFRIISLLAGIIFNYWIFGKAETHFAWIFLGVAVLFGGGLTVMCLNVKEGEYEPVPAHQVNEPIWKRFIDAAKTYFKDGYSHSFYLWMFAATIVAGLAYAPFNLYSVFYAKSIGMDMVSYGKCLSITYAISVALAYPLGALCDRFHPLRITLGILGLYAVSMLFFGLDVKDATTFRIALIVQSVLSGCYFTASSSIPLRLYPRQKFTQIGSAGGTINCLVGIVFAPAVGVFLDFTNHNYSWTFHIASGLAALAFLLNVVLYRKFKGLGGVKGFVAPVQ
ncbi:MAG: MFS transporter [Chthoniobacteraceae bacterium]